MMMFPPLPLPLPLPPASATRNEPFGRLWTINRSARLQANSLVSVLLLNCFILNELAKTTIRVGLAHGARDQYIENHHHTRYLLCGLLFVCLFVCGTFLDSASTQVRYALTAFDANDAASNSRNDMGKKIEEGSLIYERNSDSPALCFGNMLAILGLKQQRLRSSWRAELPHFHRLQLSDVDLRFPPPGTGSKLCKLGPSGCLLAGGFLFLANCARTPTPVSSRPTRSTLPSLPYLASDFQ